MLLDACSTFCSTMADTLGPTLSEFVLFAIVGAVGWWRARKHIGKVEANANAAIAVVAASASRAKEEARAAQNALARIEGSLRPAAVIGTPLPPSSGTSGTFEPVRMPVIDAGTLGGKPSIPDPDLTGESPLPAPPRPPSIKRGP